MSLPDSRKHAIMNWRLSHADNVKYINYRSTAKRFLNNDADANELKQFETYAKMRQKLLNDHDYVAMHQVEYTDTAKSRNKYYFKTIPNVTDAMISHICKNSL